MSNRPTIGDQLRYPEGYPDDFQHDLENYTMNEQSHQQLMADLHSLKHRGLTLADCIRELGIDRDSNPYAKAAQDMYGNDDCEIDTVTALSEVNAGCWVMAWVWVSNEEIEETPSAEA